MLGLFQLYYNKKSMGFFRGISSEDVKYTFARRHGVDPSLIRVVEVNMGEGVYQ